MKKKEKKSIEDSINEFIEYWDQKKMCEFLRDIIPLFKLYDVDEEDDWIQKATQGDTEEVRTVRLTRTVYLMSRLADFQTAKLLTLKSQFKDLWKKMEKEIENVKD